MASYKELLKMFCEGTSPEQIHRRMKMCPSQWRRMLAGKHFQDALKTREDLAAVMAVHQIAVGVHQAAERFCELLEASNKETVRKVCLAMLNEGLGAARGAPETAKAADNLPAEVLAKPWLMLRKADTEPGREDPREEGEADDRE